MTDSPGIGSRTTAVLALLAQFLLALVLGGWAAAPATDARHDDMMVYGAVATVFVLALAFAAANGLRLAAGLVALVSGPSGFVRKFSAPRPGMSDRDRRQDRLARLAATVVHGGVLFAAVLLIAAVLGLFTWKALDAV